MRYGCCVGPDKIDVIADAGFDFCELPAAAVRPFEDDSAALPYLRAISAAPLRPEAFNVLVPAQVPLVGPQRDPGQIRDYLRRTFGRMRQLGGEVVGVAFLIELTFLSGRDRLAGYDLHSLISY